MQHSNRIYENSHKLSHVSSIVKIENQTVKIVTDGKPNMVDALGIVLAETIFHPQGGGQPADKGTINEITVIAVREDRSMNNDQSFPTIYHFVELNETNSKLFHIEQQVELKVDSDYRSQCMRSHSAGHLIADALEKDLYFTDFQPQATHGNHFPGAEYIKVLVNHLPDNTETFCSDINTSIEKLISSELPVSISSNENNVRHVSIGDSIRMCGGTHVNSSIELKNAKVTKIKNGKKKDEQFELTISYRC